MSEDDKTKQQKAIEDGLNQLGEKLNKGFEERFEKIKAEGQKSVKDTDVKLKNLEEQYEKLSKEMKDGYEQINKELGRVDGGGEPAQEVKDWGFQLVESKAFKERPTGGNFNLRVELADLLEQKDVTSAANSAGIWLLPQRLGIWEPPTERHIRDLIPAGTTNKNSLLLPRRKASTNNAAVVAEGARKPQSDISFDEVTTPIIKLAHFIKATDEILADAPAVRSYINAQLIEGLREVEDQQILKGDGTSGNMEGLYTVAQPFNRVVANDTLIDVMRRVQTQLRLVNRSCTGYVMNPVDWEKIVLEKGTDNHYLWVSVPNGEGGQRLMAKPVRDTTKLAEGEWLAGDFRRGAQLFDRKANAITVASQNEDDFVTNKVTILAEERLGLVIYDALSFVKNAAV